MTLTADARQTEPTGFRGMRTIYGDLTITCDVDGQMQGVNVALTYAYALPPDMRTFWGSITCWGCRRQRQIYLVTDAEGHPTVEAGPWTPAPFRGLTKDQRTKRKWWWRRQRPERNWDYDD